MLILVGVWSVVIGLGGGCLIWTDDAGWRVDAMLRDSVRGESGGVVGGRGGVMLVRLLVDRRLLARWSTSRWAACCGRR